MTISSTNRRAGPYSGNGSQTAFPFSFKVFQASDMLVVKVQVSTNIETTLTLTTDYTVALNADQNSNAGGNINLVTALPSGYQMVISSKVEYLQETDLTNQGGFYPEVITDALDRLTIETQQLKEGLDRAAQLPITSSADAASLVADLIRLADSADNIDTVATNIANVNAVAGNATNVNTVAGISGNVTTVAGIASNVTSVAGNATNINTVAGNNTNITTCATNIAAIVDAPNQATAAAASAAAAAASAASGMYSAVQDKSANYTVVNGDAGDLIRVTTTSGAVTITLPEISTVSDGFKVAIVKWTGDSNQVTIARSGSDTINGGTSATIGSQYTQTTFVADFQTKQWFASTSGLGSTNVVVDAFSGNGSTTAFTLSGDAGTENNTQVFVSGIYQEKDTYSLSGTTLTFSSAPPSGTSNIEVVWTQPLPVGTPSDGTVTPAKLSTGGLNWDASGNVGVGVSTPLSRLHISGDSALEHRLESSSSTSGNATLLFIGGRNTDNTLGIIRVYNKVSGSNVEVARIASYRDGADDAANLIFYTRPAGGAMTQRFNIDSAGTVSFQSTTGLSIGRTDVTGTPATTDGNVFSGTYTPVQVSTNTNVASVTYGTTNYFRVGNMVTVSGQISVTATASATDTRVLFSLPIASNFSATKQLGGAGGKINTPYGEAVVFLADSTNDCADMRFRPSATTAFTYNFSFTYQVV